jgi:hypothetical protein
MSVRHVLLSAFIAASPCLPCSGGETPRDERPQEDRLFAQAMTLRGREYVAIRTQLAKLGKPALALLKTRARNDAPPLERVVAQAMLIRIEEPDFVSKFLQATAPGRTAGGASAPPNGQAVKELDREKALILALEMLWREATLQGKGWSERGLCLQSLLCGAYNDERVVVLARVAITEEPVRCRELGVRLLSIDIKEDELVLLAGMLPNEPSEQMRILIWSVLVSSQIRSTEKMQESLKSALSGEKSSGVLIEICSYLGTRGQARDKPLLELIRDGASDNEVKSVAEQSLVTLGARLEEEKRKKESHRARAAEDP